MIYKIILTDSVVVIFSTLMTAIFEGYEIRDIFSAISFAGVCLAVVLFICLIWT